MKAFDQPTSQTPTVGDQERIWLRYSMLKEENDEYLTAAQNQDIVGIADALTDQLYLVLGNFITHGLQHIVEELFDEVQRSNMSKLGEDGKPVYYPGTIKVGKGPNYTKPNIQVIINKANGDQAP